MRFPRSVDELTEGWIEDRLGADIRGFRAEQIAVGVGLLGYLYRLHLDGDGPSTVIAKFPVEDEVTRTHVAAPLGAYQAEVGYYRDLAERGPIGTPTVHAAEVDDATGDFVLLLEDLAHLRAEDQMAGCAPDDAALVLEHLAAHHAHFAAAGGPPTHPWLARFDDAVRQQVVAGMATQAAAPFLEGFGAGLHAEVREFVESLGTTIPSYMAVAKEPVRTVAHCDVRLDNIFFGGRDRPVVLLDWQLAGIGGVAYDVAYFLSQSMDTAVRRDHERQLVEGYFTAMEGLGRPVDREAFWIDYRRTVAFCIVYPVNVGGQMDLGNERGRALCEGMLERAVAAIEDHDALAVWPAG